MKKNNAQLLIEAAKRGDTAKVNNIIFMSNTQECHNLALRVAADSGHAQCVKLLIPVSDPRADDSGPLRLAAMHGHTECVELLIPVSDTISNKILSIASSYGHVECVKLLIPVSDVKAEGSSALFCAVISGNSDCIDLLFDFSDPQYALHRLQKTYPHTPQRWQYLEDKIVQQQREMLNTVLDNTSVQSHIKHTRKI